MTANVVRRFFRMATGQVESAIPAQAPPGERIAAYLHAIGDALRPASVAFMADLAAQDSAREIYQQNTAIAARRVAELIAEGVASGEFRPVHASFIADTAAATMARIQSGAILAATGLGDADAYDELAALLLDGIRERVRLTARIGRRYDADGRAMDAVFVHSNAVAVQPAAGLNASRANPAARAGRSGRVFSDWNRVGTPVPCTSNPVPSPPIPLDPR